MLRLTGRQQPAKGTLAARLAEKYKLAYFDTGMVYRAVGLEMFLNGEDVTDEVQAEKTAKELTFQKMTALAKHPEFRGAVGGKNASIVSAHPKVRQALLKMQQDFAKNPVFADGSKAEGAIYDGRDTGTVVCPDATVKLFVTASSEVRARRRYKEFLSKGIAANYETVLEDIKNRDMRDSQRAAAPMKPAEDAVIFDTSDLSIDEVFKKACEIIDSKQ